MSEKIARPQLGEWRTIKATAHGYVDHGRRHWEKFDLTIPIKGMYVGSRTVFNGNIIVSDDWDESNYLQHTNSREVWLFVVKERHNPVRVFPECVEAHS